MDNNTNNHLYTVRNYCNWVNEIVEEMENVSRMSH